ncbi:hypothetical protein PAXRUDRAFT_20850 [Paxillus rubicundulus Ve08.2h10]|uniref:Unplaced genomic scaffold scaffold_4927, whole genome shotgun sequence n=1 Tax=Paxillus rubicundulus Ve08.2h10 TaxID=930991 RepID=A0A0D0D8P7_9AGAM|nr:hypothetical protein PAXRUDRAFT_20850 [Paxillus rubicundulus Ve08.2h10]
MQAEIYALQAKVQALESDEEELLKSQAWTINARWLTSVEGLWECDAQDAAREAKEKKKTKAAARKVSKQANRITRQAAQGSNVHFSGALSTKSNLKEDLIDIAKSAQNRDRRN